MGENVLLVSVREGVALFMLTLQHSVSVLPVQLHYTGNAQCAEKGECASYVTLQLGCWGKLLECVHVINLCLQ